MGVARDGLICDTALIVSTQSTYLVDCRHFRQNREEALDTTMLCTVISGELQDWQLQVS